MTTIDADGNEAEIPRKKFSGKRLILFIVIPLVLAIGAGAALYFLGIFGGKAEEAHAEEAPAVEVDPPPPPPPKCSETPLFFNDLPELLVNLDGSGPRPVFLKLKVALEICDPKDAPQYVTLTPRIMDILQVYLRELRQDDLRGSAGIYRLQEELLYRVNIAVQPLHVKDVLINEILVQ